MKYVLVMPAVLLLAPLCAAQARPRDDAMAGVYRCSGLQSDRQWLDCFYGAAEPARAALALKPALPGQIRLAQSPLAGSPVRPSAVRSQVIAGAGACYNQPGDRDWLDCYYRAAQPMRQKLGLAASAASPPSPAAVTRFGITQPADGLVANQIVSRMSGYSFDAHMIFTVTLENGQTWRQIEGDTDAARWKKAPASYVVTIRRGMSGSFILMVRDEPHAFRVRRIS